MTGYIGSRDCGFCGPRQVMLHSERTYQPGAIVCPTCEFDPIEVRSVQEVESIGFAEAYRREWRRNHGLPLDK